MSRYSYDQRRLTRLERGDRAGHIRSPVAFHSCKGCLGGVGHFAKAHSRSETVEQNPSHRFVVVQHGTRPEVGAPLVTPNDSLDPLILCFGAELRSPPVIALNTQQSASIFVLERVVGADDGDGLHPTPIQLATGRYGRAAPRPEAMDQSPALPIPQKWHHAGGQDRLMPRDRHAGDALALRVGEEFQGGAKRMDHSEIGFDVSCPISHPEKVGMVSGANRGPRVRADIAGVPAARFLQWILANEDDQFLTHGPRGQLARRTPTPTRQRRRAKSLPISRRSDISVIDLGAVEGSGRLECRPQAEAGGRASSMPSTSPRPAPARVSPRLRAAPCGTRPTHSGPASARWPPPDLGGPIALPPRGYRARPLDRPAPADDRATRWRAGRRRAGTSRPASTHRPARDRPWSACTCRTGRSCRRPRDSPSTLAGTGERAWRPRWPAPFRRAASRRHRARPPPPRSTTAGPGPGASP